MKQLSYEQWFKKRTERIIKIFGSDWFALKNILELGACHGDIGVELVKLGSNVLFSDARQENLNEIYSKLPFKPKTLLLNQNFSYYLNKKFDLVLHLGLLYHIENWKNDLRCAMDHSNLMILETSVNPIRGSDDYFDGMSNYAYEGVNCLHPVFTQESVEQELTDIGCKFFRFDTSELDCDWAWLNSESMIRHVYSWNYDNYKNYLLEDYRGTNVGKHRVHFRRMWLVIK